jgi:hypothetical protein
MPSRSQRHKVKWQGVASNGERRANDALPEGQVPAVLPPPTITSLGSNTAPAGSGPITLIVNGTNYDERVTIRVGVVDLIPTQYVNPTRVQGTLDTSMFVPSVMQITVRRGAQVSNSLPFTFT